MKIEIAESLLLSWLRHVRGCRIVQLNWKPSQTWEASNKEQVEALYNNSRDLFSHEHNLDLYGKNSSVFQLVQQAEIDAIGFCDLDERPSMIAVDVAFHESGLNYGTRSETVSRVTKKVLRTLLAMESYFPDYTREIIFATPKIHKAVQIDLNEAMITVDRFLEKNGIAAECRVVANADFFSGIVEPVRNLSQKVADTSELFMRSLQLLEMVSIAPVSNAPIASLQLQSEPPSNSQRPKLVVLFASNFNAYSNKTDLQKVNSPDFA